MYVHVTTCCSLRRFLKNFEFERSVRGTDEAALVLLRAKTVDAPAGDSSDMIRT